MTMSVYRTLLNLFDMIDMEEENKLFFFIIKFDV